MTHPKTEEELRKAMELFRQGKGPAPVVNLDEYEGPVVRIPKAGVFDTTTEDVKFYPDFREPIRD